MPAETILEVYTALRPHRSSADELETWAARLESEWDAPLTAAFVREAARRLREAGAACRRTRAGLSASSPARPATSGARCSSRRYPELGLVAMDGPNDPEPSLVVDDGRVVEIDGCREPDFDVIDHFLARHGIDLDAAAEAQALTDEEIARRLVDVDVPRDDLVRLSRGLTPARLARIAARLDPVEMMFALKKLRARRAPANQAHVTNLKDNPALLAADAAEAAARGFAEVETTVGVSRYAPLNAIAILVGSQTGRPGVMTQCAVEERRNLDLAIRGLVTYAETLSVYGTEPVFVDGDDTPWSKAFLGSAYASRGVKIRFTSGGGSEALMGRSLGYSMLYLEARCLAAVRAAGSQGVQNGSISCVALALAVPGGTREILAENLLAAWLDLEVASGNDAIASHSEIRKTAKLMGQLLPGHRLRHVWLLGHAALRQHVRRRQLRRGRPRRVDDRPARLAGRRGDRAGGEDELVAVRERAARARSRPCSPSSVSRRSPTPRSRPRRTAPRAATCPDRDRAADAAAADRLLAEGTSGVDVVRALDGRGFTRCRRGDRRHAAAADLRGLSADLGGHRRRPARSHSAVNDPNRYSGPGTGTGSKASAGSSCSRCPTSSTRASCGRRRGRRAVVVETGEARAGERADEVVVAVGPAFGDGLRATINDLPHADVLAAVCRGIRDAGAEPRLVRVRRSSDVAFIGHDGALLSGSGIALGLQSKGTAVIHRADLQPLDNLELFGMSPLYSLDSYLAMGRNAAGYALGHAGRAGSDADGQLRPHEADRQDDPPARPRDRGDRARGTTRRTGHVRGTVPGTWYAQFRDENAQTGPNDRS